MMSLYDEIYDDYWTKVCLLMHVCLSVGRCVANLEYLGKNSNFGFHDVFEKMKK